MVYGLVWRTLSRSALQEQNSDKLMTGGAVADNSVADRPVEQRAESTSVSTLLRHRQLWALTFSYAAYGYFQYLFFYWMSYYFDEILQLSSIEARWSAFWIMLAMGVGMALGGFTNDFVCRRLGTTLGRRSVVVTGMGLGAVFGLLGANGTEQYSVVIWLSLSMASLGLCESIFWTTVTGLGRRSRGFAAAFMNTGGNLGGLASPVLTPVLAQTLGWPGAIAVACAVVGLGGLAWLLIKPLESPNV